VLAAGTKAPLRNARINVTLGAQSVGTVFTDDDGRFVVPSLAAGSYGIAASKSGYITSTVTSNRPGESGRLVAGDDRERVEEIELYLPKAAAISGRIVDDRGDPLIGMKVTAARLSGDATAQFAAVPVATAQLDDLGEYRFGGLPEGTYRVGVEVVQLVLGPNGIGFGGDALPEAAAAKTMMVNVDGKIVVSGVFAPRVSIFYPGVSNVADSQLIRLAVGEERASLDFSVPAITPRTWLSYMGARPASPPPDAGSMSGRVTRQDGRPIPGVTIRLLSESYPGMPPSAVADDDGRYELTGLSPASFRVVAERSGFLSFEHGQRRAFEPGETIELGPGQARDGIDITLPAPGSISGWLVDEYGDPAEGVDVRVLQIGYEAGRPRLVDAGGLGSHRTDDLGRYRIYGLRPGRYIVSAVPGRITPDWMSGNLPGYAPTYYPGTPNPGDAQWISVDLSAQMTGVDMTLSRTKTARVSGMRFDEAGDPAGGIIVLAPSRRSGSVASTPVRANTEADGSFEFPNVPPGEYVLQAATSRSGATTEGEFASMFVTVNGVDVTGLVLRTSSGSTIRGRVRIEGGPEPWLWSELTVAALPLDLDRSPLTVTPANAGIGADWTFEMAQISGPRVLRLTTVPPAWTLKAVMLNGIDVTDTPLPFGAKEQSIENLEVVLTDRVTELSGVVTDARGRAVANTPVLVFAGDRERWGPASRFVATTRSGRDGTFSVRRLPPGGYFVAPIDRMLDGEWQDPNLLALLVPSAATVSLAENQRVSVTTRLIVR
jgi:hypothetical protein